MKNNVLKKDTWKYPFNLSKSTNNQDYSKTHYRTINFSLTLLLPSLSHNCMMYIPFDTGR